MSLATPVAQDVGDASSAALCGSLAVVSLFDVIQWVCASRQSWLVRLWGSGLDGSVTIVDGELIDARCGGKTGHDALVGALEAKVGRFELQAICGEVQRSMHGNWMATLLTALQKADEGSGAACTQLHERGEASTGRSRSAGSGQYSLQLCSVQPEVLPASAASTDGGAAPPQPVPASSQLIDLGFAAFKSGDVAQARLLCSDPLRLDPNNRALQFNLRTLETLAPPK